MSDDIDAFADVLDPRTESQSDSGVSARRKVQLSHYEASLSTLAAHGVEVPHRDFSPEDAQAFPGTVVCPDDSDDTTRVHLFQDVREIVEDSFGDFGAAGEDTNTVVWTVVGLDNGTVNLTVVGDWGRRRDVPVENFAEAYDPITVETGQGPAPRYGY